MEFMFLPILYAYAAGAVSSVNPCGFALLPAYLARRIGANDPGHANWVDSVSRAFAVGSVTTGGFIAVFGGVGVAVSLGAYWLTRAMPWAGFAIGIVLAFIGLYILAGRHINVRIPFAGSHKQFKGLRGDFVFGVGYGTASLTCTLPILLSITSTALTGGLAESVLSFVAYAVGMGTILTALAVAAALSRDGLAALFKGFLPYVYLFSGGLLLLAGLYVTYYWGFALFGDRLPGDGSVIRAGENLSNDLKTWLEGEPGRTAVYSAFFLLISLFAWLLWRRFGLKDARQYDLSKN